MLSTEEVRGLDGWREKRSEGTGRKEGAVVVGACVYIRERGERVEDAQSVNRNARTRTRPRPCPGHASSSLHPPPYLSPFPLPPGKKIPSLIPNKVSRQLRELGSLGASGESCPTINYPIHSTSPPSVFLFSLLFLLLVSPETLPCLGSEPVCLFVCLSVNLVDLPLVSSRLVLSCPVPSCASCFILFSIPWPPTPASSALPPSSLP